LALFRTIRHAVARCLLPLVCPPEIGFVAQNLSRS